MVESINLVSEVGQETGNEASTDTKNNISITKYLRVNVNLISMKK